MTYSYFYPIARSKIPITIRRAGKKVATLSGTDLVKKVTKRAIERFLCDVLEVPYSSLEPAQIEYQPVFCRGKNGNRALRQVRIKRSPGDKFTIIFPGQIENIGVTDNQFLSYLQGNSIQVHPKPGMLFVHR